MGAIVQNADSGIVCKEMNKKDVEVATRVSGRNLAHFVGVRMRDVVNLGECGVRKGRCECKQPQQGYNFARSSETRHGVRVKRVTNRQISERSRYIKKHNEDSFILPFG